MCAGVRVCAYVCVSVCACVCVCVCVREREREREHVAYSPNTLVKSCARVWFNACMHTCARARVCIVAWLCACCVHVFHVGPSGRETEERSKRDRRQRDQQFTMAPSSQRQIRERINCGYQRCRPRAARMLPIMSVRVRVLNVDFQQT